MSEIYIEEENTVYELDEECLREKKQKNLRKDRKDGAFEGLSLHGSGSSTWLIILLAAFGFFRS